MPFLINRWLFYRLVIWSDLFRLLFQTKYFYLFCYLFFLVCKGSFFWPLSHSSSTNERKEMRAIHIVRTRLSSSFRPILLDFVACLPPCHISIPRRLICAATKANGGRSGSIVAPLVTEDFQKIDVNPPKGTRDFPPEDMRLRNWLFNHFKEVR